MSVEVEASDGPEKSLRDAAKQRFAFRDFQMSGDLVRTHDDRSFGPILWSSATGKRYQVRIDWQDRQYVWEEKVRREPEAGEPLKLGCFSCDVQDRVQAYQPPRAAAARQHPGLKPNILIIFTDDQGWDVSNRKPIVERMPNAQGFDYYFGPLGANDGDWKLIYTYLPEPGQFTLYNLRNDPSSWRKNKSSPGQVLACISISSDE